MSDSLIMAATGIGAVLMASAGALSTGRLAAAGVAVMFVAAVFKYISNRNKRIERRIGSERRQTPSDCAPVNSR
jgi:hypothetical protein